MIYRLALFVCLTCLLVSPLCLGAQQEEPEQPPSPFEKLDSLYIRIEGMPERANFTLGDIDKRVRRLLGAGLPRVKVIQDEAASSGVFRIAFPEYGSSGDVVFEVLVYQTNPDTGETDMMPAWQEKLPFHESMRKFFFFSEILDQKVGAFIEEYKRHEAKQKGLFRGRKKPEITKDRLRMLEPPQ